MGKGRSAHGPARGRMGREARGVAIRFHCPFCDQLLSITTREVGPAVECPRCGGGVGVPGTGEVVLTPGLLAILGVGLVALTGLAFAVGLLFGALF